MGLVRVKEIDPQGRHDKTRTVISVISMIESLLPLIDEVTFLSIYRQLVAAACRKTCNEVSGQK